MGLGSVINAIFIFLLEWRGQDNTWACCAICGYKCLTLSNIIHIWNNQYIFCLTCVMISKWNISVYIHNLNFPRLLSTREKNRGSFNTHVSIIFWLRDSLCAQTSGVSRFAQHLSGRPEYCFNCKWLLYTYKLWQHHKLHLKKGMFQET